MRRRSFKKITAIVLSMCCLAVSIPAVTSVQAQGESKNNMCLNDSFESGNEGMPVEGWELVPFKNSLTLETDASKASYATTNHTLKTAVENGNKVAQLNRVGGGYAAMASQAIAVTGGQGYQISLDYKTIKATNASQTDTFWGINLVVRQINENGDETWKNWSTSDSKGYGQTVSSEWSSLNQILMMESDTVSAVVYIAIRGGWNSRAEVLLDNVKMQKCDANNVLNGDFETSQGATGVDGWKLVPCTAEGYYGNQNQTEYPGYYVISRVTEENNSYMRLSPKNKTQGYVVAQSSYVTILPNQTYTLSYDLKAEGSVADNGNNGSFVPRVCVYYYNSNKEYISNTCKNQKHSYEELVDWKSFVYEYTAPANAAYMTVNFFMGGAWNKGTPKHYVDNVNVLFDDFTQIYNGDGEYVLSDGTVPGWSMTTMVNDYDLANPNASNYQDYAGLYHSIAQDKTGGVNDSGALKVIRKQGGWGYAALTSTRVKIIPGKSYDLSYVYQLKDIDGKGKVYALRPFVIQYDAEGTRLELNELGPAPSTTTTAVTEWTKFSNAFTANKDAAYCIVYIGVGGIGGSVGFNVWIDNIMLSQKPPWTEESTNYEGTGSATGNYTGNYDITFTSIDGRDEVLKLYVTRQEGCLGAVTYFSEKIPVTGNTAYTTSYDLKIEGRDDDTKPGAVYVIRYLNSNDEVCGYKCINNSGTSPRSNQDWTTYSEKMTTPESAVSAQIGLLIGSVSKDKSKNMAYYYDNIMFTESSVDLPQSDEYRCEMKGATIRSNDSSRLRFVATAPIGVTDSTITIKEMGIIVIPAKYMMEGNQEYNKDAALTLDNTYVTKLPAETYEMGQEFYVELNNVDMNPNEVYRATAYVIYESMGLTKILYSTNQYTNTYGITTAENGVCDKSVYGIAKEIAQVIKQQNQTSQDLEQMTGEDIFKFVSQNYQLLSKEN